MLPISKSDSKKRAKVNTGHEKCRKYVLVPDDLDTRIKAHGTHRTSLQRLLSYGFPTQRRVRAIGRLPAPQDRVSLRIYYRDNTAYAAAVLAPIELYTAA